MELGPERSKYLISFSGISYLPDLFDLHPSGLVFSWQRLMLTIICKKKKKKRLSEVPGIRLGTLTEEEDTASFLKVPVRILLNSAEIRSTSLMGQGTLIGQAESCALLEAWSERIRGPGHVIERNGLTHPNKGAVNRRRIHG